MRHFGHGGDGSGWVWIFPGITMVLFWVVLVALIALIWRSAAWRSRGTPAQGPKPGPWSPPAQQPPAQTPEQVLADRLARGEIEVDEYQRRMDALRSTPPPQ